MNTTHTKEPTEQKEKLKGGQLLETIDLRDYFAAQAMQGLLANGWCSSLRNDHYGENAGNSIVAIDAYMMADAMLKARAP